MPHQEATPLFNRSAIAVAVSAACGTQAAYAQDPQLEEIVVTATKREASLQDVPLAVTAFTEDDIVRQGFETIDDYVGKIPGLTFSRREPGGTTVLMRGCSISGLSFGTASTTSIYLDEQPITMSGRNPDPRLIDIARVEALSGPQGTLFGDASQCGSLRIITNKPDTTAFSSWVDVGINQVKEGDTGYELSGMVNVPLAEDRVGLRLVGFVDEEAGYIDNVLATSPGGTFDNSEFIEEDVNSATNTGGRAALRAVFDDNWTVDATAIYQKKELDGFGDADLAENFFAGADIGELEQVRFNPDNWSDEWYQLGLSAEGSLGFADFVIAGAYFNRETVYEADATAYQFAFNQKNALYQSYYDPYIRDITAYDFGGDPQAFAFNREDSDRWSIEARLSTPADSTSRWSGIVGVFYNREEGHALFFSGNTDFDTSPAFVYLNYLAVYYDPNFPLPAPPSGGNWFTGVYDGTFEQKALFGEVGFEVTDEFNITVGGRFFDIDLDRTLKQGALFPLGTEPDCDVDLCFADAVGTTDETGFVPKLTLDYHLDDETMVYATYSEGFRRGGANAARENSIFGPGKPLNAFDSDTIVNYEIGLKGTWAGGRFRLNATAYHMIWEDIQLQVSDPFLFTLGIVNFPEAELDGVEAQFSWLPAEGWDVSGTLGWNDGEISEDAVLFSDTAEPEQVFAGTELPIMPDWKGSLGVEYRFQQELLGGQPYFRVDHTYTGEAVNSFAGFQAIVFVNPVRTMDSYNITDVRFGIEAEDWTAALFVENLLDERAEQFYNDRWAQTRLSINQPLTVGVTYRKYFE